MNTHNVDEAVLRPVARALQLNPEDSARFLRIVSDSLLIKRHYQIYLWLNGEVQQFLPHEILISAWGDFAKWSLKLDVISSLPGVRTEQIANCRIDDLVRNCFAQWVAAGRQPLLLKAETAVLNVSCSCLVHKALRNMRALLVHGVRDERGGYDSLYIALHSGFVSKGRSSDHFVPLVDSLIAQIDVAFRKVAAFPLDEAVGASWLDLSSREQGILDLVCRGKTNLDIAGALDISPFTVKNHMQRIFRKIGVRNRAQAALKYNEALQLLKKYVDK